MYELHNVGFGYVTARGEPCNLISLTTVLFLQYLNDICNYIWQTFTAIRYGKENISLKNNSMTIIIRSIEIKSHFNLCNIMETLFQRVVSASINIYFLKVSLSPHNPTDYQTPQISPVHCTHFKVHFKREKVFQVFEHPTLTSSNASRGILHSIIPRKLLVPYQTPISSYL